MVDARPRKGFDTGNHLGLGFKAIASQRAGLFAIFKETLRIKCLVLDYNWVPNDLKQDENILID